MLLGFGLIIFKTAKSESIYFSFTDGTHAAFNLTLVRNITFAGDVMSLSKTDGTDFSWNVSSIRNFRYSAAIGIDEVYSIKELSIYPNPSQSEVHVSFELTNAEHISITICDTQGRVVYSLPIENRNAGRNQWEWQGKDNSGKRLPIGNYIFTLSSKKGTISRYIVLQ